jgi:hypothetical protein
MRRLLFVTAVLATLVIPPDERLAVARRSPALAPPSPDDIVARFKNRRGQDCDIVRESVTIAGRSAHATGTLCRRLDGQWHFIP